MKNATPMGLNPDGTPHWVEVPEPAPTQTAHNALAELAKTKPEQIFGPHSNAVLANKLGMDHPEFYQKLRLQAVELGLVPPHKELKFVGQ